MSHFIKQELETYVFGFEYSRENFIETVKALFIRPVTIIYIYVDWAKVAMHSDNNTRVRKVL